VVFYLFFTYKFPDLCGALEAGGFTDAVIVVILRKRRICYYSIKSHYSSILVNVLWMN